eukprot:2848269-Rhodomonas_salina.1
MVRWGGGAGAGGAAVGAAAAGAAAGRAGVAGVRGRGAHVARGQGGEGADGVGKVRAQGEGAVRGAGEAAALGPRQAVLERQGDAPEQAPAQGGGAPPRGSRARPRHALHPQHLGTPQLQVRPPPGAAAVLR